jgi:predicted O-linked N-acetylglucosamine transferase (SPINDLY family)
LSVIGLSELAASSEDEYFRIAQQLAADSNRLINLRHSLRAVMQASSLMNLQGFVEAFQNTLLAVYDRVLDKEQ